MYIRICQGTVEPVTAGTERGQTYRTKFSPRKNDSIQITVSVQHRDFVTLDYLGESKGEVWTVLQTLNTTNNLEFYMNIQLVPRSKHSVPLL